MLINRSLWNVLWVLCIFCVTLICASALIVSGVVYLLRGLVEALIPYTGVPVAFALTGLACVVLLALLGVLFGTLLTPKRHKSLSSQARSTGADTANQAAELSRAIIRQYPLEAAGIALLAGYAIEDSAIRSLVLKSGRAYMEHTVDSAIGKHTH